MIGRFSKPGVQHVLEVIGAVALIGAIALPVGWSSLVGAEGRGNACAVLRQLGLEMGTAR